MKASLRIFCCWLRYLVMGASSLVISLCLLLFAQWPLREWVQDYSRQANDIGQILFALYAAVAITAASLSNNHLAITHHHEIAVPGTGTWRKWALLLCVGPWALLLIWAAAPQMLVSVAQRESFSEGNTPGYFMVRIALVLLAVLVLGQAVHSAFAHERPPELDHS